MKSEYLICRITDKRKIEVVHKMDAERMTDFANAIKKSAKIEQDYQEELQKKVPREKEETTRNRRTKAGELYNKLRYEIEEESGVLSFEYFQLQTLIVIPYSSILEHSNIDYGNTNKQ